MFGDKRNPSASVAAEIDRVIGLNIRRAREDVRLGQLDAAGLLSIPVHLLRRYEEGLERTPANVLLELTKHVGCQLADLFAGMPSMEADDDFPGSRVHGLPLPSDTEHPRSPPNTAAGAGTASAVSSGSEQETRAVAAIIDGFSRLGSRTVKQRLVALLQALA